METFHDVISGNQLLLVDFLATWCHLDALPQWRGAVSGEWCDVAG